MNVIPEVINRFRHETAGQDLIEYALLAGFLSIVAATGASLVGTELDAWYNALSVTIGNMQTAP